MADYSIFSQAQGPSIDTDLLTRASVSGTNIGNARPSTASAIAQGVTNAVNTGLDMYGKVQDIQVKQQQIDQAPLEAAIKEQQLENQKIINEINQLNLRNKLLTEEQDAKIVREEAKRKLEVLEGTKIIADAMASSNPNAWREMFKDPRAQAAMQADSKLAERAASVTSRTDLMGNPVFSPEEIEQTNATVFNQKKYESELRKQEANAKIESAGLKSLKETAAAMQDGNNLYITSSERLQPSDWANDEKVKIEPTNTAAFDNEGYIVEGKVSDGMEDKGKFNVLIFDESKGKWKKAKVPLTDSEQAIAHRYRASLKASGLVPLPPKRPQSEEGKRLTTISSKHEPIPGATAPVFPVTPYITGTATTSTTNMFGMTAEQVQAAQKAASPIVINGVTYVPTEAPPRPGTQSKDAVTRSQYDQLRVKAAQNPKLADAMANRGLIPNPQETVTTPQTQISATTPEQEKILRFPAKPVSSPGINGVKIKSMPKVETVEDAKNIVKTLPKEVQKHVDAEAIHRIEKEPLLRDKSTLFKAVVAQESKGKRDAVSPTGAVGLAQLTKAAAKDTNVNRNIPEENVRGGFDYLQRLLTKYKGNEILALMAYNGGMGLVDRAVDHAINLTGSTDWKDVAEAISYLQSRGYYSDFLTPAKVKEIISYPAKVLAYKEAFNSITYD